MTFRKATIHDLTDLNRISLTAKKHWGYPEEWIRKWMNDLLLSERDLSTNETLLMEIDQNTIGFCSMKDQKEYYEVLHLWVLPDFIGKGYGKTLLNKMLSSFVLENKPVWVLSDPNAEAFYESQGFDTFDKVESFPKGRYLPLMKIQSFLKP